MAIQMIDLDKIKKMREEGRDNDALNYVRELADKFPKDAYIQCQSAFLHDSLNREAEAVKFYENAISLGLSTEDERDAYLGLGSTYRALGQFQKSKETFLKGLELFPEANQFQVFLAMTLYNLGEHHEAMKRLLLVLANTSNDSNVTQYGRAIRSYAEDLDSIQS